MKKRVASVISRLEAMPKQGETYSNEAGRHGWRNPIRSDTGMLLHNIVKARQPQRILELGTAYGLSALYMASALNNSGHLDTIEFEPEVAQVAQANLDEAGLSAIVYTGDGIATIPTLHGLYDIVFLDAQKDQYKAYIQALQKHGLLAEHCVILADNVTDRATEVAAFMEYMEQYDNVVIPTECGLSIAVL